MKLIIAGGRDYEPELEDWELLDREFAWATEVVCGDATGADTFGAEWAQSRGIMVSYFPAQWTQLGLKAGPIRNRQMAEYADAVLLFPGGDGTRSMHNEAMRAGIKIYDADLMKKREEQRRG